MRKTKLAIIVLPLFILFCHTPSFGAMGENSPRQRTVCLTDSTGKDNAHSVTLKEVVVNGSSNKEIQKSSTLNVLRANKQFIDEHFNGSLMQTLSRLPGVKAMSVGSGESKPVIRGLGFNRVLVAENGIKHESQQWGDDHGIEIDQFGIDQVDVIKGPSALTYGSDAIGGVINLKSNAVSIDKFSGHIKLYSRSSNESVGGSAMLSGRNGKFWYKANATFADYADSRVPIDSIEYYSYWIKLKDRRLRNTAGREMDGSLMLGYASRNWHTSFRLSDVNTKSGFFANAHGLEVRLSDIDYDASRRDIDLPYHVVNHFSVSNHTDWLLHGGGVLESSIAYQNNRQREYSEPVSHGYMPTPPDALERSFVKQTSSAAIKWTQGIGEHWLQSGINAEYQHNRRGGWGFILPDFEQWSAGIFASDKWRLSEGLSLSAGIRYDHSDVSIHSYRDWYKTPSSAVTQPADAFHMNEAVTADSVYVERSANLSRSFNSLTWSVGVNLTLADWVVKINLGKSFRMPIAKELGMDGVNYSIFRYEKGNAELKPEESYQLDMGIVYEHGDVSFQLSPYLNYFPNYIYLNPTAQYKEGLQLYYYTQAKVVRWGFEAFLAWQISPRVKFSAEGEYLYSVQKSGSKKGYGLPFSTPWSGRAELRYLLFAHEPVKPGFVAIEWQVVGSQNRIVPPEEKTKGHQLLNIAAGKTFHCGTTQLEITLRAENLLNKRYYDHTSHYRLIGVPEPGLNFSAMMAWHF